jgi:AcrR family transcriptional regulator
VSDGPLTPDKRRELTRRHLLDAAATEFARQGFHGTSLDAVAAAAGFTKGAVYSNFENKADLFLAVLDDRMVQQAEILTDEISDASVPASAHLANVQRTVSELLLDEEWTALWLEFLLYAARNPDARARLVDIRRRQRVAVEAMIEGEYRRRGAKPDYPVPLLALISTALFDGLDIERLIDPATASEDTQDAILAFLFATIGVPEDPPD